jgi:hypothetical protein
VSLLSHIYAGQRSSKPFVGSGKSPKYKDVRVPFPPIETTALSVIFGLPHELPSDSVSSMLNGILKAQGNEEMPNCFFITSDADYDFDQLELADDHADKISHIDIEFADELEISDQFSESYRRVLFMAQSLLMGWKQGAFTDKIVYIDLCDLARRLEAKQLESVHDLNMHSFSSPLAQYDIASAYASIHASEYAQNMPTWLPELSIMGVQKTALPLLRTWLKTLRKSIESDGDGGKSTKKRIKKKSGGGKDERSPTAVLQDMLNTDTKYRLYPVPL